VQDVAVGSIKQSFITVTSVVKVVHVDESHFPASTFGRFPDAPYVAVHVVAVGSVKQF